MPTSPESVLQKGPGTKESNNKNKDNIKQYNAKLSRV